MCLAISAIGPAPQSVTETARWQAEGDGHKQLVAVAAAVQHQNQKASDRVGLMQEEHVRQGNVSRESRMDQQ